MVITFFLYFPPKKVTKDGECYFPHGSLVIKALAIVDCCAIIGQP